MHVIRRTIAGFGRILITLGVLLLLFVAYQLWGTNIAANRLQDKAASDFDKELAAMSVASVGTDSITSDPLAHDSSVTDAPADGSSVAKSAAAQVTTLPPVTLPAADSQPAAASSVPVASETRAAPGVVSVPPETVATTTTAAAAKAAGAPVTKPAASSAVTKPTVKLAPKPAGATTTTLPHVRAGRSQMQRPLPGKVLGRVQIKSIGLDEHMVEGSDKESLKTGPGHYVSTPLPGQPGNVGIACHRTTYGAPCFNLDRVKPGAEILIQTLQGTFRYIAERELVVPPSGPEAQAVLAPTPGENVLTMTTCHPQYTAKARLVLRARLEGPAAASDFYTAARPEDLAREIGGLPADDPTAADTVAIAPAETSVVAATVPPKTAPSTTPASSVLSSTSPAMTVGAEPDPVVSDSETSLLPATTSVAAESNPSGVSSDPSAITEATPTSSSGGDEARALSIDSSATAKGPNWHFLAFAGARSIWLKTLAFALVCALIWLLAWLLARPRNLLARSVIYLTGFLFLFGPVLFLCYAQLAQLLPDSV